MERNYKSEFHFKCKTFIADVNLKQELWHGVNIWITGRNSGQVLQILVQPEPGKDTIEWNVSGLDAIELFSDEHITGLHDGLYGLAGESGGHISIDGPVSGFKATCTWIIKTNGGNGGRGENGVRGTSPTDGIPVNIELDKWINGNVKEMFEKESEILRCKDKVEFKEMSTDENFYQKSFTDQEKRTYILFKGKKSHHQVHLK